MSNSSYFCEADTKFCLRSVATQAANLRKSDCESQESDPGIEASRGIVDGLTRTVDGFNS